MSACVCAGLFGGVWTSGLKGEGRRDWEVYLRNGVSINHMITLESIEFVFTYIIPLYIYLAFWIG